ncbi:hypothetical protein [Absidia glauca]|uniref:GDP-mannose transporter n=1 Tax=Absidia glauca TaxID=4829 RepID=A0A168Q6J6_ABSGL|nr:hypothetical protein [Absidia glauca]
MGNKKEDQEYSSLAVNTSELGASPTVVASRFVDFPPWMKTALPILCYCTASIMMTVVNKYVVSGDFNMVFLLLAVQVFKFLNLIKYREFELEEGKKWFPIVLFLVAMIYTGSKALQYLAIPVYTIFKNLTIILIAYGDVIWFGGTVTLMMMVSFTLMTVSSAIAGWTDVADAIQALSYADHVYSNTMIGYFWMAANCVSSASFVLYMRKRMKMSQFKEFDVAYYNNLLSIPVLLIPSLLLEDWSAENLNYNFPLEVRHVRVWAMIFSGVSAFGISYASAWCVRTTSSTTYSMVGNLNKLPIAISGLVFFGDPATLSSVSAIMIGFAAGMVYAYAKAYPPQETVKRTEKK